tara:strand:- start:141393 stop:141743 length:351 start_codon:yes stop_codon:yes gene_type:complete
VLRVIQYQALISIGVAFVFMNLGSESIWPSLYGGLISVINTLLLARGVNNAAVAAKEHQKGRSAWLLFKSLFLRMALILIGFYIGIVNLQLEPIQILVAFALAQLGYVFFKTKYIY